MGNTTTMKFSDPRSQEIVRQATILELCFASENYLRSIGKGGVSFWEEKKYDNSLWGSLIAIFTFFVKFFGKNSTRKGVTLNLFCSDEVYNLTWLHESVPGVENGTSPYLAIKTIRSIAVDLCKFVYQKYLMAKVWVPESVWAQMSESRQMILVKFHVDEKGVTHYMSHKEVSHISMATAGVLTAIVMELNPCAHTASEQDSQIWLQELGASNGKKQPVYNPGGARVHEWQPFEQDVVSLKGILGNGMVVSPNGIDPLPGARKFERVNGY